MSKYEVGQIVSALMEGTVEPHRVKLLKRYEKSGMWDCEPAEGGLKFYVYESEILEAPVLTHNEVDHPKHYTQYEGFEVIDITEQLDFCTGNLVKYVLRAGHKGNKLQDLEKAAWYLNRLIEKEKSK